MSDRFPNKILKEVFLPISVSVLDMINLSLLHGYMLQTFKVAVFKLSLQNPFCYQNDLINHRPISNFHFLLTYLVKNNRSWSVKVLTPQ